MSCIAKYKEFFIVGIESGFDDDATRVLGGGPRFQSASWTTYTHIMSHLGTFVKTLETAPVPSIVSLCSNIKVIISGSLLPQFLPLGSSALVYVLLCPQKRHHSTMPPVDPFSSEPTNSSTKLLYPHGRRAILSIARLLLFVSRLSLPNL